MFPDEPAYVATMLKIITGIVSDQPWEPTREPGMLHGSYRIDKCNNWFARVDGDELRVKYRYDWGDRVELSEAYAKVIHHRTGLERIL